MMIVSTGSHHNLLFFFLFTTGLMGRSNGVWISSGAVCIGNSGNGSGGRLIMGAPSSSMDTSITSSSFIGCNSSRSSRPGASGIGPRMVSHFSSREVSVNGFSNHATAPAEWDASSASSLRRRGARKTILQSPPWGYPMK